MKAKRTRKEYMVFGILIAVILIAGAISIASIFRLNGNARVVNFAGIVRGGTQKLIKEEIMGWYNTQNDATFSENSKWYPDDALQNKLDTIVEELLSGKGPNGLTVLPDKEYLGNMQKVKESWAKLKDLIGKVRNGDEPSDLFAASQDYFALVNDTVFSAETYSNTQVKTSIIILIAVNALSLFIMLAIMFYYTRRIANPLSVLSSYLHCAATTGEIALKPEDTKVIKKYSHNNDEVGNCIKSVASFVNRMIDISKDLELIASGDLTADCVILSEKDIMGNSLRHMNQTLNKMFEDIKITTEQVYTNSAQIAENAQELARGSVQQTATVEQLSDSIADIAEKTKHNAQMAEQSAKLAVAIKQDAEKGSNQMNDMISATHEINQASQNISKVIKVIDDIAFQTNILALNAAVEAARAGQQGKGFAVVAEEVRNLAAKSAEAAKDTGGLIANSMEKAELGAHIAEETAASLMDIVSGINESSQIAVEIANSSAEQTIGIEQINSSIDQVTQFVKQNSSTADIEAATSQELNEQANVLEELVSQFKLKT